jgi:hypothetical protein|nr:hypothetical protein [Kofleriaceae bacterium]
MTLRPFLLSALIVGTTSCSHLPGGHSIPGGGSLPATSLDPNACGGFSSAGDVGAKFKAFLTATQDLQKATADSVATIKNSCVTMGKELGMSDADLGGDDVGATCQKVIAAYQANLSVAVKSKAALKIEFTPGKCTLQAEADATAGGGCSGTASGSTSAGSSAQGQCAATAKVEASIHATCTPPSLSITADAKLVVDKSKFDMTIKAMNDGLPQILSVAAKIGPIKEAAVYWAETAKALGDSAKDFASAFKDQATCVGLQAGFAAKAAAGVQANVSVSVSVSASASGSVGG